MDDQPRSGEAARNELSTTGYWDGVWAGDIRLRLPSPYIIATRNLQRLLRRYVRRGDSFLEIGCAPGKILAWAAADLGAQVSGLDYSAPGIETARHLFTALDLAGELRCESLEQSTFPHASFDIVYSSGLIEHFADPRAVVRQHLDLVKPGGAAVITVPNYRGIYGRLQRYFDAELLAIHNLELMTCDALLKVAPVADGFESRAYQFGRLSPWLLTPAKRWPSTVAGAALHAGNALALLQPFDVAALAPTLVLEVRRRS